MGIYDRLEMVVEQIIIEKLSDALCHILFFFIEFGRQSSPSLLHLVSVLDTYGFGYKTLKIIGGIYFTSAVTECI